MTYLYIIGNDTVSTTTMQTLGATLLLQWHSHNVWLLTGTNPFALDPPTATANVIAFLVLPNPL